MDGCRVKEVELVLTSGPGMKVSSVRTETGSSSKSLSNRGPMGTLFPTVGGGNSESLNGLTASVGRWKAPGSTTVAALGTVAEATSESCVCFRRSVAASDAFCSSFFAS